MNSDEQADKLQDQASRMVPEPSQEEELPRYKLKLQDDDTGVVMAVGTDDLDAFKKTDLMAFIRQFKRNVRVAEKGIVRAAKRGEEV